jgi:hypothetical protein
VTSRPTATAIGGSGGEGGRGAPDLNRLVPWETQGSRTHSVPDLISSLQPFLLWRCIRSVMRVWLALLVSWSPLSSVFYRHCMYMCTQKSGSHRKTLRHTVHIHTYIHTYIHMYMATLIDTQRPILSTCRLGGCRTEKAVLRHVGTFR